MTSLLSSLDVWSERLLADIRSGQWRSIRAELPLLVANRRRADELDQLRLSSGSLHEVATAIWPRLKLISCWADGASQRQIPGLESMFPGVEIQPKGLLATECFATLPLLEHASPALSLRSHFFEFEPDDSSNDETLLAHELSIGRTYRLIVTTGGGLYRYQLHDRVRVEGFLNQCPLLSFQGRGQAASDLVGEKLTESLAKTAIERVFQHLEFHPRFVMLAPVEAEVPFYCLYVQDSAIDRESSPVKQWTEQLDLALKENPHYAYAISLGQLQPAQIRILQPSATSAEEVYLDVCQGRGQRLGDIKPVALHPWTGWSDVFQEITDGG